VEGSKSAGGKAETWLVVGPFCMKMAIRCLWTDRIIGRFMR